MKTIEKIRQKIEELYDGEAPRHDQQCDFSDGYFTGLSVVSNFLDTLSEEPEKSLAEAADEMAIRAFPEKKSYSTVYDRVVDYNAVDRKNYRDGIIAGAEWQKQQMIEETVEGYVDKDHIVTEGPFYYIRSRNLDLPNRLKEGDKVRIVVIKAEEEE